MRKLFVSKYELFNCAKIKGMKINHAKIRDAGNLGLRYSCADWNSLCDHVRDVPREDIFKLSASAAVSEVSEWVQVGIDTYIPYHKYQVKPHSCPWFSAACAAAIVHRNHFY